MATVTAYTAERTKQIEDTTVVSGQVTGDNLVLLQRNGTPINAGNVRGPQGNPGLNGINGAGHIICTSTTRPALTAADAGKTIYETDTQLVFTWTGTRWRLQERVICTSLLRPVGLTPSDEGIRIYETDTDMEYVWTGTRWKIKDYIICTSTTRPAGLTTSDIGVTIYEIDTGYTLVWLGTAWGNSGPRVLANVVSTGPSANNTNAYAIPPGGSRTLVLPSNRQIRLDVASTQNCSVAGHRMAMTAMIDGVTRANFTTDANRANVNFAGNAHWLGNVSAGSHVFAIANISSDGGGVVVNMLTGARLDITDLGPAI